MLCSQGCGPNFERLQPENYHQHRQNAPFQTRQHIHIMGKSKSTGAVEAVLSAEQKAALEEARSLQVAAARAGILTTDKPEQYPVLAPSKGEAHFRAYHCVVCELRPCHAGA